MKLFNLAIASIVDANTRNGVNRQFIEQFASTTSGHEHRGREIRAKSLLAIIGKIKDSFKQYIGDSKARAQNRRDTKAILQMSQQMLDDIGLTHADLHDLRSGKITIGSLGSRRELNRSESFGDQLSQSSSSVTDKIQNIEAANPQNYRLKKCA